MPADAFNSVGGYTIGIPPVNVIDTNGNLTCNRATIGNLAVSGNVAVSGTITATNFYGNVQGNITANISIYGNSGEIVFNDNGFASSAEGVVYDNVDKSLTVENKLTANSFALGLGVNQFYSIDSSIVTTNSLTANQVIHRIPAQTVAGLEYTIIATDTVANTRQMSKLNAIVLGNDVGYAEFGTTDAPITSEGVADFRVQLEGLGFTANVVLTATPLSAHLTNYKILVISYKS